MLLNFSKILSELLNSFPTKNMSEAYQNFTNTQNQIISLCKQNSVDTKLEGILLLMETFGSTFSLDEQFDILLEYCPNIIKTAIYQPNPDYYRLYFQLGNFIISMLYTIKFKIYAKPINKNNIFFKTNNFHKFSPNS